MADLACKVSRRDTLQLTGLTLGHLAVSCGMSQFDSPEHSGNIGASAESSEAPLSSDHAGATQDFSRFSEGTLGASTRAPSIINEASSSTLSDAFERGSDEFGSIDKQPGDFTKVTYVERLLDENRDVLGMACEALRRSLDNSQRHASNDIDAFLDKHLAAIRSEFAKGFEDFDRDYSVGVGDTIFNYVSVSEKEVNISHPFAPIATRYTFATKEYVVGPEISTPTVFVGAGINAFPNSAGGMDVTFWVHTGPLRHNYSLGNTSEWTKRGEQLNPPTGQDTSNGPPRTRLDRL